MLVLLCWCQPVWSGARWLTDIAVRWLSDIASICRGLGLVALATLLGASAAQVAESGRKATEMKARWPGLEVFMDLWVCLIV